MSRVAKSPIAIPAGVNVSINNELISVKGPLGTLEFALAGSRVGVSCENNEIQCKSLDGSKHSRAMSGTVRATINNMVTGVSKGFEKKLEVNGVGFRLSGGGKQIEMALGFSHPVKYTAPEGVELKTDKMEITVSGIDKQKVGQAAAEIRSLKKPEPYKGKGIKYVDEVIIRKAGKAGKK